MSYRLLLIFTTLLVLSSRIDTKGSHDFRPDNRRIFIDDPSAEDSFFEGSGREPVENPDDEGGDDDDFGDDFGSGDISGSGDFEDITTADIKPNVTVAVTLSTTTAKALTACQQLLKSSTYSDSISSYVPECTREGDFQRRQCKGGPGVGDCWCVDPSGREISGTMKHPPYVPDCEFGTNLKECVFSLLKHHHGLLGEFRPRCTIDGEFEKIQCRGMMCWCVDNLGKEIPDTKAQVPEPAICDKTTTTSRVTTLRTIPTKKQKEQKKDGKDPEYLIPTVTYVDDNVKIKMDQDTTSKPVDEDRDDEDDGINNEELGASTVHVMKQPGLLAAVIGGAVVGLLCAVLLVMFIVYRMRKKDEGSYALDEPPKYPNYSYSKAQDKEFYA
ncbi:hypothetical protein ScPMuIL_009260 [Solemya velum]